jgi:hypothetical protein
MESSRGGGWTRWILRRWISSRNRRPHPVLNRDYATRIARDWNVKHSGSGYVTRFDVRREFLDRYPVQQAGGRTILEYWIPAEDLPTSTPTSSGSSRPSSSSTPRPTVPDQQAGPRHAVLDVVQIADHPILAEQGLPGQLGVVLTIRRYPEGHYRYSVGSAIDDEDDEVPGIYDEEHLLPTGQRSDASRFGPPAPFRLRDVVQISDQCEDEEGRGHTGVIDGAYAPDSSGAAVGVWIETLGESVIVDVGHLTQTGERLPPPPLNREATSTQVSTDGQVIGHSSYVIVDDIDQYL